MELLINTPADFRSKDELPLQIEHADFTFFPRIEVAIYKERPGCAVCLERSVGGNAGRAAAKGFFCAEIQKEPVLIFPGGEVQTIPLCERCRSNANAAWRWRWRLAERRPQEVA